MAGLAMPKSEPPVDKVIRYDKDPRPESPPSPSIAQAI
ncbi:enoyl-CoA hydratase domain protein [Mycobacterium ulcerans str. Harvey]|uniref:Enoyl-CoA hydratase domain protein n=1 Tax=Mycobacterium ulcerans str. Harvey TaxID=1299332 RepID=A0ABP3AP35_MYCUL|nr:enoyl-CoA hydratase domain protein [Mycobacterium ulcerans str. Harvey]